MYAQIWGCCRNKQETLPFRIAHVGAGSWSRQVHGPALRRLAEGSLVALEAICDLQMERAREFRDRFHYRLATDDIREMLETAQPDAIVCTVQPSATTPLVHSLLPLRIPLFIEKPPGICLQEARDLAAASEAADVFTFVAFNRRFIPSIVRLKEWTTRNTVRFARAEMLRTNRLEGDFAIATGIHLFDAIRFLIGHPEYIEVKSRAHDNATACDYLVQFDFSNSAAAEISLMLNTGMRRESYYLGAAGASAEAALGPAYSSELCFQGYRQWSGESITQFNMLVNDPLVDDGILGEYEEFFRLLTRRVPSTCSLTDAALSMQLAEAVQNNYSGPLPPLMIT
jgi:predicted dehydrogenase